ncbi:MAG TPA: F0F1 ATP synthase subunit B [Myxococcota bacterium]|nr:F0F1 ATP synthase subunit B [Myxococcota bacterium]HRY92891.1 F0F1 ATP synthase subunit B [Myxococcota bacterium]HSA21515.1 F0F1 ATP synthase subunit B [Myxococcota bacterium]
MALMQIDPGVILWTLIIFVCLLFLLKRLAWKPLLGAVAEREKRIRESLETAERVKADSEKALAEQRALLDVQRQEMAEAMKRVREESERGAAELLEKARKEATEIASRARQQVDEDRRRAMDEVRLEAVELAMAAATHLLEKSLDADSHRRVVKDYIASLPQNLRRH